MSPLPENEERYVREYVESQIRDEDDPVTLVQRVGSRRAAGRSHDLYDVHTKKGRWWVITDITNLYSQEAFPSIEMAFTYHLGIGIVLSERSRTEVDEERKEYAEGSWRRFTRAADAMNDADEAEDFQAIGVMCREALLALVRENLNESWIGQLEGSRPQVGNFKAWSEIFAERLLDGRRRSYFKSVCDKTWDLVVELQHKTDATPWDAELVMEATSHVLTTFMFARFIRERGAPDRCPVCGSYRVGPDGEVAEKDGHRGYRSWTTCSACEWRSAAEFEPWN